MLPGRDIRPLTVAGVGGVVVVAAIALGALGLPIEPAASAVALGAIGAISVVLLVGRRKARELDDRAQRLLTTAERTSVALSDVDFASRLDAFGRIALAFHALARRARTAQVEYLEAERRFRTLADGSVQGILVEVDWKPLYVNRALATLLGFDDPEAIRARDSFEPFITRADRPRLRRCAADRAAGHDVPEDCEFAVVRHDGRILRLASRSRPIEWHGRHATQHTVLDITARRQAEDQLREREQQIRAIFDYSPTEMLIKDTEGRYVFVSRQFETILGMGNEQARGRLPHEVFPPERAMAIREHDLEVLESGRISEREEEITLADGIHTILTVKFPIPDPGGSTVGIGAMMTDLTERRRTEAALRASEHRFRDFAETAADWMWEMDAERRFSYVSDGFESVTGIPPGAVLGRRIEVVFDHELRDASIPGGDLEAMAAGEDFEIEIHRPGTRDAAMPCIFHLSGKPVRDHGGRLVGFRGTGRDITESRRLSEQLAYQASHDPLTGLFNRREFERRLKRLIATSREQGDEHVLCYLDLDQFKVINDTSGHSAGDELLRQLAHLLDSHLRPRDTLARLGGDEFGLLLERCSIEQAWPVVNAIRSAIEEFRFPWKGQTFSIGVSAGMVAISAEGEGPSALMSAADSACYAAKEQGRNRIQVYREDDTQLARRHGEMAWVSRIQHALDDDRFELVFQPIVPLAGRESEPPHFEILLRLREHSGELVLPGAFLGAAERFSLAVGIDRWVIDTAFQWLAARGRHGGGRMLCSINLSGHSLSDEAFLDYVIEQFDRLLIDPTQICFEVTETAAISNMSSAMRFINVLKEIGCLFSLDDFGSGLSSFAYLRSLPVDFLKIDGLFVRDVVDDPLDLALVRSINEIGHTMGKRTIAEFAETPGVLDKLREIGVDYAQGYTLGMPQPIAGLDAPLSKVADGG